ncbi:MAG: hypothetical protein JW763_06065 [candidate division Zixibacteria bacterium]|nr:hypothetical protein [candidate division Zixibacteria bacterium]
MITYRHPGFVYMIAVLALVAIGGEAIAASRVFSSVQLKPIMRISESLIVTDSDSLFYNGRRLERDHDYRIDYARGMLSLSLPPPSDGDSLVVYYTPLPSWLKSRYGIAPPETSEQALPSPGITSVASPSPLSRKEGGVFIKGAKRFSILSQSGGTSEFSQSLDLSIAGELSSGVTIQGSVTDRGYDPTYGTVNSRISELDKLYLAVRSRRFSSEIGNLEITTPSGFGRSAPKQVSGITVGYADRTISLGGILARPRGRFASVQLNGIDQMQGPYRIATDRAVTAIVPGSEQVWVDGRSLERGADKDYVMDYPGASITFMPRVPIDSRSRIEVDFEPLTDEYQQELYRFHTGVASSDSTMSFTAAYYREGDVKDQPETGELSAEDIALLESIGDAVESGFRDGAVADTTGSYAERFDSLGHRYFVYVGEGLGEYRVTFTAVDASQGEYVYEGGERYRYVGAGAGDYLPIVRVAVPERKEYYEVGLTVHLTKQSRISVLTKQSDYDANLYSDRDDNDNRGGQYMVEGTIGAQPTIGATQNGAKGNLHIINKTYTSTIRRNRPDRSRRYLIPTGWVIDTDEIEATGSAALITPGPYHVYLDGGMLSFKRRFSSVVGTFAAYPDSARSFLPSVAYTRIRANLDSPHVPGDGIGDIAQVKVDHALTRHIQAQSGFIYDRRRNTYQSETRGTTEYQYDLTLSYKTGTIGFQHYEEDTLQGDWHNRLRRDRGTANVTGKLGPVRTDLFLLAQRNVQDEVRENQYMTRVRYNYSGRKPDLSIDGTIAISDENRYERGVRYLEVNLGEGQYVLEDGQYIPDPEGNFIEVEEVRSTQASVKSGQKSFNVTYSVPDIYARLVSTIDEDMQADEDRNLLWLLPFYSDNGKTYQYRTVYYSGEVKLLRFAGYYAVTIGGSFHREDRLLSGNATERREQAWRLALRQGYENWLFRQEGEYFAFDRDEHYAVTEHIDGLLLTSAATGKFSSGQIDGSLAYRYAEDLNGSKSRQYIATVKPRVYVLNAGESSVEIKGYIQDLIETAPVSYRLTDNLAGKRGVVWIVRSDVRIRKDFRLTLNCTGRHSDDRKPRLTARGEFVASF